MVFDILAEDCVDDSTVNRLVAAGIHNWNWTPSLMVKSCAIDFFIGVLSRK